MTSLILTPSHSPTSLSTLNPARSNRWWIVAAIMTLALAIIPAVIWPGEVSWMCDEPLLVGQACYFNMGYQLAPRGLGGTFFVAYGPFPTQFYQLVLLFTHDVRTLVAVHAFCLTAVMAGSLLWLSRTLRLTPWYAAAIVLAPYLWWSQRVLWDASFALPIGVLGMAAYAAHLRTKSRTTLAVAVAALSLTPLIHPQGLPLFAAFAAHALWNFRRQPRRWSLVPVALAVVLALNAQYMHDAIRDVTPQLGRIFHSGYGNKQTQKPLWISMTGPFLSGRLFDGSTFENERFRPLGPPMLNRAELLLSQLATPLICGGIVVAVAGQFVRRKNTRLCLKTGTPVSELLRRAGQDGEKSGSSEYLRDRRLSRLLGFETKPGPIDGAGPDPDAASIVQARATLTRIALAALILQILLAGSLHVPPWPQYCFGTFAIHLFFGWLAIDFLQRFRLGIPVVLLWGSSLAFITLGAVWQVHVHGWNRSLLSPSLDNQMQIAEQLNDYADQFVMTDVGTFQTYPMAIRDLRVILPPKHGKPTRVSPHGLILRYTADPDPSSRIELIESSGQTLDPDRFKQLDVRPMPKMY